jgi:hypothetical protein
MLKSRTVDPKALESRATSSEGSLSLQPGCCEPESPFSRIMSLKLPNAATLTAAVTVPCSKCTPALGSLPQRLRRSAGGHAAK